MKRVHAFTLAEMIVALLLLVIVLSMAYTAYFIVSRTAQRSISAINAGFNILFTDNALNNLITEAETIEQKDSFLWFLTGPDKRLVVLSDSVLVFRNKQHEDLIALPNHIRCVSLKDSFLQKDYVGEIRIAVSVGDTSILFIHNKNYASDFFMNNQKR